MVRGLHRNNSPGDIGRVLADVIGKFRLRARGPDDEDFAGIGHGPGHLGIERLVRCGMTASGRVGLMVKVPRRQMGVQRNLVGASEPEMTFACE